MTDNHISIDSDRLIIDGVLFSNKISDWWIDEKETNDWQKKSI